MGIKCAARIHAQLAYQIRYHFQPTITKITLFSHGGVFLTSASLYSYPFIASINTLSPTDLILTQSSAHISLNQLSSLN